MYMYMYCYFGMPMQLFMRMGVPQVIVSDQGREFNNALNDDIAKQLGIRRRLTTPYHSQVCVYTAIQWTSVNCTLQVSKCGLCVSNSIIFCRQTDLMSGLTRHCRPCLSSLFPERRNSGVGTLTHVSSHTTHLDMTRASTLHSF